MAIKDIKVHPDKILLEPASPLTLAMFTNDEPIHIVRRAWLDWIKSLLKDLTDTMLINDGVGLAAPQIGVPLRVIVYREGEEVNHLINPEIISRGPSVRSYGEGCLSVPDVRKDVRRAKQVVVRGYSVLADMPVEINMKTKTKMLAFILQHEIDHLNGITIMEK
jgi:peptide deformylase